MATRDGAAAIGRDDLGALEPGRWADLVQVDLADPAFVDPADDAQLLSNLVWAGGARLVRDVWVAGEQVLADGEPTRVDRTGRHSRRPRDRRPPPRLTQRESPRSSARVATFAGASRHLRQPRVGTFAGASRHDAAASRRRSTGANGLGSRPVWTNWSGAAAESAAGDRPAARRGGRRRRRASRGRPGPAHPPRRSPLVVESSGGVRRRRARHVRTHRHRRARRAPGAGAGRREAARPAGRSWRGTACRSTSSPVATASRSEGRSAPVPMAAALRSARSPRWSRRCGWSTAMASCDRIDGRTSTRPASGWARSAS
jgi:hypothetical protein